jgi:hypothetical protein
MQDEDKKVVDWFNKLPLERRLHVITKGFYSTNLSDYVNSLKIMDDKYRKATEGCEYEKDSESSISEKTEEEYDSDSEDSKSAISEKTEEKYDSDSLSEIDTEIESNIGSIIKAEGYCNGSMPFLEYKLEEKYTIQTGI